MLDYKLLFAVCLIGLQFSCKEKLPIDCLSSSLKSGLIAYYPFQDGTIIDVTDNEIDLEFVGNPKASLDRFGNENCAMSFKNSINEEQFLRSKTSSRLTGMESYSISLWYFAEDIDREDSEFEILVQKGNEILCPGGIGEWSLSLFDCRQTLFNGNHNFVWSTVDIQDHGSCEAITKFLSERWTHIVAVQSVDKYEIYFNGELKQQAIGDLICTDINPSLFGEMIVGKGFTGILDEIMIYNRALTQVEISEIKNLESCCD